MNKSDLSKSDKKKICQTLLQDLIKVSWGQVFVNDFKSTELMALMWSEIDPAAPAARASASPPQAAWEFSQKERVLRGGGRSKWDMASLGCGQEEQIILALVKSRVCCH